MSYPVLSCIIPAYNRIDHFSRCIMSAISQDFRAIEIIVSDDSSNPDIRKLTHALTNYDSRIRYIDGPRNGSPVDNWNHGMAAARGNYIHVLHQDEFLISRTFFSEAVSELNAKKADVIFGNISPIGIDRRSRFSQVKDFALRLKLKPWTLYAANWIGPTATMVFRAATGMRFDPELVNTVDVDLYYRLLGSEGQPIFLPGLSVSGLGHHDAQISARIEIAKVSFQEIQTIIKHRPGLTSRQVSLLCRIWKIRQFAASAGGAT